MRREKWWEIHFIQIPSLYYTHLPLSLYHYKDIIVNLYKLHFLSFPFSLQSNKKVFHPFTFPPFKPNTHERKPNLFYSPIFPSSHFSTPPTKQTPNDSYSLHPQLPKWRVSSRKMLALKWQVFSKKW